MLGYADARNPDSARGGAIRLVDAPLDEAVGRLVAHIRQFQPDLVIGHDALGQLTGHPDHRRTHQITLLTASGRFPRCCPVPTPGDETASSPPSTSPVSASLAAARSPQHSRPVHPALGEPASRHDPPSGIGPGR
ncbi:PIG-L deacetylase family protein [Streptomyces changanensis]|uniref:PIG-L deacetylase family protein n=1 Tax=Streptomyces TaxID=1883 RepID=UPI0038B4E851